MEIGYLPDTNRRKNDHIRICAEKDIVASCNYLDSIELVHAALPEIDYDEIDLSTTFLGTGLKAPLVIAAMTGGGEHGTIINESLARAPSEMGIAMGVGSQRPALEDDDLVSTFSLLADHDIPLTMGNIGMPQLVKGCRDGGMEHTRDIIRRCLHMLGTGVICVHLNYLQEVVQPEGEKVARGGMDILRELAKEFTIIVKETGGGLDGETIEALKEAGVAGVDVGGRGGTSFSAVEFYRSRKMTLRDRKSLGKLLWDWGIPTPASVMMGRGKLPLIATGGVRNGLDVFKLLALGADVVGIAGILLPPALKGYADVLEELERVRKELKTVMFLTGCGSVADIARVKMIISPPLSNWLSG